MDPLQVIVLIVATLAYARRSRTLARRGRPVPARRRASFYLGMALLVVALAPPLDTLAHDRFYAHMVQHLLIGDLAALAIVAGLTGPVLRPLLAVPVLRPLRALAHPLVALPLWAANFVLWHVPALYAAALEQPSVHALQHGLFFATGALMWAAIVEPVPGPAWFGNGAKAVYVLAVRAIGTAVAFVFVWAPPLYPDYVGDARAGVSPVADQATGGLIMFLEGSLVTVVAFAWLFLRWTREAELRQALVERGHDPRVAARAARYGRSALARGVDRPPAG